MTLEGACSGYGYPIAKERSVFCNVCIAYGDVKIVFCAVILQFGDTEYTVKVIPFCIRHTQ